MERIKNSFSAKTAAFIIILLCSVMIAVSAVVVIVNAEYHWYSKGKDAARQDIYGEVASIADERVINQFYGYEGMGFDSNTGEGTDTVISEDVQFIYEEDTTTDFGYIITAKNTDVVFESGGKTGKTRTINAEFIKSGEAEHEYVFMHDTADIKIYLGEINKDSIPEELFNFYNVLSNVYKYGKAAIGVAVAGILIIICLFLFLITSVGTKEDINILLAKIPIEVYILLAAAIIIVLAVINDSALWGVEPDILVLMIVLDTIIAVTTMLGLLLITIIKGRHKTLWNSSICYLLFKAICWFGRNVLYLLEMIPLVWKTAAVVFLGILVNLFITLMLSPGLGYNGGMWLMWVVGACLVEGAAVYIALILRKLKFAGQILADGDLEHQIDKKGLFGDFAKHADDLNSISQGMAKAVEEKMKSERFKTELITNVSHDIKTPLTSIINYVDLIKAEDIENDNVKEYINVLDRQSQRLKKLTEDLVEASKAASGTVSMDLAPCQIGVLMSQAAGEYKEKLENENLQLISDITEGNGQILADGRSMWRIFDNIFNNICKYSQPDTRVYQSLEIKEDKAIITYKNTSRYQLNISEEELMERFVRGDSSRHTEGSGLGLSISKNLAELQGGSIKISIDGDLFKVILEFPINK